MSKRDINIAFSYLKNRFWKRGGSSKEREVLTLGKVGGKNPPLPFIRNYLHPFLVNKIS